MNMSQAERIQVHPDYVFMGSFGVGGKKVGANGSVTDYLIRFINTTVVRDCMRMYASAHDTLYVCVCMCAHHKYHSGSDTVSLTLIVNHHNIYMCMYACMHACVYV